MTFKQTCVIGLYNPASNTQVWIFSIWLLQETGRPWTKAFTFYWDIFELQAGEMHLLNGITIHADTILIMVLTVFVSFYSSGCLPVWHEMLSAVWEDVGVSLVLQAELVVFYHTQYHTIYFICIVPGWNWVATICPVAFQGYTTADSPCWLSWTQAWSKPSWLRSVTLSSPTDG